MAEEPPPDTDSSSGPTVAAIPDPVDDPLALPATPLAAASLQLVRSTESASVANHSIRSFLFARLVARRLDLVPGQDYRETLLFLACVLHDLGLGSEAPCEQRFEVEGADQASAFLTARGLPAGDVDEVWAAIALHSSPGLAERWSVLSMLTNHGVAYDFGGLLGPGPAPDAVTDQQARMIHQTYPRLAMIRSLTDAIVAHAAANPQTAVRYTLSGEYLRERSNPPYLTRTEQAAASSRWGD